MAGSYDGSIRIDTAINAAPIDNGLAQIENKIKSMAATIGLAFGVKELIDFGKRSIDAASDLAEAQNVVDTAFGAMSWKMEQFAATALETYGISELTAKNMGSTYMAMAKGMGVATDAASDMAVTLTGRLSDIMSFYNKTQSEVDTIGRALITGETESLKAIGVVMTQTNLSAYAMAQGFSKTYAEMSSNEQLLVRYKYFLEQTALAQDDFAKTSEGWANQTRLLSERINEFMTNLGSVIMNVLTPALQFANEAVTFLNDLFFGGNSDAKETTAVKNAEAISDEVTSMGAAADKSKKKLNNLLSGFDELHIISGAGSDKDKQDTTDAGIDTSNLLGVNLEADTETASEAAKKYRQILEEIYFTIRNHPFSKAIVGVFEAVGNLIGGFSNKKYNVSSFVNALLDILGAIIAFKTISSVVRIITSSISTLKTVITTAGTALGIGAGGFALATGVAAGFALIMGGIMALSKSIMNEKIEKKFGDIRLSFEQIEELCEPIGSGYEELAKKFETHRGKVDSLKDEFSELADAMGKTFTKYEKLGTVSIDDLPDFSDQLNTSIDKISEFLDEQTFGAATVLEEFFSLDGIDEDERKSLDEIADFGVTLEGKVETIRKQIQSITQTAADENRGLLESEIKNIRDLYNELESYANIKSNASAKATWDLLDADMGNLQIDKTSYEMLLQRIGEAQDAALEAATTQRREAYESINEIAALKEIDGVSQAEIEKFLEDNFRLIDKTYDDARVDATVKANDLRKRVAAGLAESIIGEDGLVNIKTNYANPIEMLMNYDDITVKSMVDKITNDIKSAEDQILDSAFDKDRAQQRFTDSYKAIEWEAVKEDIEEKGILVGSAYQDGFDAGSAELDLLNIPSNEVFKKSGMESGEAWNTGFEDALNNSGNNFVMPNIDDKVVADLLGQLSNTTSYVSPGASALAGAQLGAEQYFNIQLNIDGVNMGKQTVKTNGSSTVSVDWHDPMKTNGG